MTTLEEKLADKKFVDMAHQRADDMLLAMQRITHIPEYLAEQMSTNYCNWLLEHNELTDVMLTSTEHLLKRYYAWQIES